MNKELFLNSYIDKISTKFGILKDLAFEILCLSSILDISFDEAYDEASTLENKDGSHDGGFDGIYIDKDEKIGNTYSQNDYFKSKRLTFDLNINMGFIESENKFEILKKII